MRAVNYASLVFFLLLFCLLLAGRVKADSKIAASTGLKVFIIDTGVDLQHRLIKNRNVRCIGSQPCSDGHGHGTGIVSLVLNGELTTANAPSTPVCPKVEVIVCNYFPSEEVQHYYECLAHAVAEAPLLLNFSSTSTVPVMKEYEYLKDLQALQTFVIVAAGNEGDNILETPNYPTMYAHTDKLAPEWAQLQSLANIITVGATTRTGERYILSNYIDGMRTMLGTNVRTAAPKNAIALMTGTSASTALYTNKLLRTACGL